MIVLVWCKTGGDGDMDKVIDKHKRKDRATDTRQVVSDK